MSARNKELAAFVLDQLEGLNGIRAVPMMGGYLFYVEDRIFGGLYGSEELLVRLTPASRSALPEAEPVYPYEGSKQRMLPCPLVEDREAFQALVQAMLPELPAPKKKKKASL